MNIHGLQKMTLLDYPGKTAATVFLGGCDFKCPYCHNSELIDGSAKALLTDGELFSFLEKRKGMLDGVALTGGEPCLREDLCEFAGQIKAMGFSIKLDTNGNHPQKLTELVSNGLVDYVAMDIKNSFPKYGQTIGIADFDVTDIKKSISFFLDGNVDYEFRTTVVSDFHEDADFELIGDMIKGAKAYYLQQYTLRDTVPDKSLKSPSKEDMERFLEIVKKKVPNSYLRGV